MNPAKASFRTHIFAGEVISAFHCVGPLRELHDVFRSIWTRRAHCFCVFVLADSLKLGAVLNTGIIHNYDAQLWQAIFCAHLTPQPISRYIVPVSQNQKLLLFVFCFAWNLRRLGLV
jgi:hypothetical protein